MNKNIYMYWDQGFENAPYVVKKCAESWKKHNTTWNIFLLDNNKFPLSSLNNFISNIQDKNMGMAALSDIIRIYLLKHYGGLWVDATTFCNKPLDEWAGECFREAFMYRHKEIDKGRIISSWFINGKANCYLINRWYHEVATYWKDRKKTDDYFWFFYLFTKLYFQDKKFKKIWDNVPKRYRRGVADFGKPRYFLKDVDCLPDWQKKEIDDKKWPLYKLSWKFKESQLQANHVLNYILNQVQKN